jgi:c-di-GMP-related signal transduction protein
MVTLCRDLGIRLFQGYCFARPAIEALPAVSDSNVHAVTAGLAAKEQRRRTGTLD